MGHARFRQWHIAALARLQVVIPHRTRPVTILDHGDRRHAGRYDLRVELLAGPGDGCGLARIQIVADDGGELTANAGGGVEDRIADPRRGPDQRRLVGMRQRGQHLTAADIDQDEIDIERPCAGAQQRNEPAAGGKSRGGLIPGAAGVHQAVLVALEVIKPKVEVDAVGAIGHVGDRPTVR